jgi:hypothetical protein
MSIIAETAIDIHCDNGHKPWHIGQFALDVWGDNDPATKDMPEAETPPLWLLGEGLDFERGTSRYTRRQNIHRARQWIDPANGQVVDVTKGFPDGSYMRYHLRCMKCRFTLVRNYDRLSVALDRLAAERINRITLRGLAEALMAVGQ